MEIVDFEFKKERRLGEFVQDFISLLKIIFPHLIGTLLQLLILPICGVLLVGYYVSTQINTNADYSSGEEVKMVVAIILAFLALFTISLIAFGLAIEYFILLRNRQSLLFTSEDIWMAFKNNVGKYFKFLVGAIFVSVIVCIPVSIAAFLVMFIPIVGGFAFGIFMAIVGLWYFTAFMLYREGYYSLTDAFTNAYDTLKAKIFEYGIASYVVNFIFQSLLALIVLVPAVIIVVIQYNFLDFNREFFDSFYGKILVTSGGLVVALFFICYYILAVISYGIIYESAKELAFGENIFSRIQKLGRRDGA